MSKSNVTYSWSTSLCTILCAIFVASKVFQLGLAKDWSWWAVFSPVWASLVLVIAVLILLGIVWGALKLLVLAFDSPKPKYPKAK